MTPPRLVFTDLDGTLFDDTATLAPATLKALAAASAAGIESVAATGRSHRTAAPPNDEGGVARVLLEMVVAD